MIQYLVFKVDGQYQYIREDKFIKIFPEDVPIYKITVKPHWKFSICGGI